MWATFWGRRFFPFFIRVWYMGKKIFRSFYCKVTRDQMENLNLLQTSQKLVKSLILRSWFQTNRGCENSASYLKIQARKTFSYPGHALVTLYAQFLCSDWSKFDRWVHAENLCSILKVVYFDRVLCQLVMFLTVFFHWMYKMKYSCYQESSVIHG